MNLRTILPIFLSVFLCASCATDMAGKHDEEGSHFTRAEGDSTVYGIAAEDCNDSILVFLELPYTGADPDTVNILDALRNRQMFGRAKVGDNVAILLNDSDHQTADRIIVTGQLAGTWCYNVYPRLRRKIGEGPLPPRLQQMLEEPREYGLVVKPDGVMLTMGVHARRGDEQLPVVYPRAKNYGQWAIFNGRLVLSEVMRDTTQTVTTISTDTAELVRLRRDTLILRFNDGERKFYRKTEEELKGN